MDHAKFFAGVRTSVFGGKLTSGQVSGVDLVLAEAEKRATPLRWLAYMLATDFHETAATMQPIEEYGKGKGKPYGKPGKHGQSQHGRGLVQLTWDVNYERADAELKLEGRLLADFRLAMQPAIAVAIMFTGMEEGWFTAKKLGDYLTPDPATYPGKADYRGARRIINGMDRADLIAGYALRFEAALKDAGYGVSVVPAPRLYALPATALPAFWADLDALLARHGVGA